jgi:hypothetical protein
LEDKIDKNEVKDCGCLSENIGDRGLQSLRLWHFPILCTILYLLFGTFVILWTFTHETIFGNLWAAIKALCEELGCWWVPESYSVTLKGEHNILQSTYVDALIDNIQKGLDSNSDCGCGSDNLDEREVNGLRLWHFPILCTILFPLFEFFVFLWGFLHAPIFAHIWTAILNLSEDLGCWWTRIPGF